MKKKKANKPKHLAIYNFCMDKDCWYPCYHFISNHFAGPKKRRIG